MPNITTRTQFIENCKRRLGWPVLNLEIDDDQINDRVDEALDYWNTFVSDGNKVTYWAYQVTASDITNKYITLPSTIKQVLRVLPLNTGFGTTNNMFDIRYQLRMSDMWDFSNISFTYWYLLNRKLREIELFFSGEILLEFNQYEHVLRMNTDWSRINANEYIVLEVVMFIDPETVTDAWNSRIFQKYATALIKEQWGTNTKKYRVQLLGGAYMEGQQLYDEAVKERLLLEEEIRKTYEEPPGFIVG